MEIFSFHLSFSKKVEHVNLIFLKTHFRKISHFSAFLDVRTMTSLATPTFLADFVCLLSTFCLLFTITLIKTHRGFQRSIDFGASRHSCFAKLSQFPNNLVLDSIVKELRKECLANSTKRLYSKN
jgi:hypothetical protein